jgi:glucose/mannose-6-phosphate isomerase
MPTAPLPGALRMRALATEVPEQLLSGFQAGLELSSGLPRTTRTIFACGMGGSAIAPDLVRSLTDSETDVHLHVSRSPDLPASATHDSIALLLSYSGNTWETLAAYDAAARRKTGRLVVASGGELAARALRDGVPHLPVPAGMPPRAAVGHFLGGLLGLLDGFFPESNESRVKAACRKLVDRQKSFASASGEPARLARWLGSRALHVYAEEPFGGLARRWKTQVEENAKRLAYFDTFPELFHNAVVGWDAMTATERRRRALVLLESSELPAKVRSGTAFLERIVRRAPGSATRVRLEGDDRLEELLYGLSFADHFSLFLAERGRVDPLPIVALEQLKRFVARS